MKITLLTGQTFDFKAHFGFDIKVVRSAKAKRLTLRIDEKNHHPVVTAPKYCFQKTILKFLETHHDWMINMLARLPQTTDFSDGDTFSFFEQTYTIKHQSKHRGTCFFENTLLVGGNKEFLHRRVVDFLKQQTLQKLVDMSIQKAKLLDCHIANISLKDTKSRWGSCSTLRNINYNWRICLAPLYVIEYLVCHEVSHLKHPDHSRAFWQTLAEICPNYKDGRRWLKIKGKELYKYR